MPPPASAARGRVAFPLDTAEAAAGYHAARLSPQEFALELVRVLVWPLFAVVLVLIYPPGSPPARGRTATLARPPAAADAAPRSYVLTYPSSQVDARPSAARGEAAGDGRVFADHEVDRPAASVPGSLRLAYPPGLLARGVQGHVVVQFVVDTLGRADMGSWLVLESTDARFAAAAEDAVRGARFSPAEAGGRRVRQRVQLPFAFTLGP